VTQKTIVTKRLWLASLKQAGHVNIIANNIRDAFDVLSIAHGDDTILKIEANGSAYVQDWKPGTRGQ
jgi:hypothetical protein